MRRILSARPATANRLRVSANAGAVADEPLKVGYASLIVPFFDRFRRQPPFVWIALAVGIALFCALPFSVSVLMRAGGVEPSVGWTMRRDDEGRMRVTAVDTNGPANGALSIGDQLVSVNGIPPLPRGLGWTIFMDLRPGDRYHVRLERGSATVDRQLTVASRSNLQDVWLTQVPLLVISFCFFATGLSVALLSAKARRAAVCDHGDARCRTFDSWRCLSGLRRVL